MRGRPGRAMRGAPARGGGSGCVRVRAGRAIAAGLVGLAGVGLLGHLALSLLTDWRAPPPPLFKLHPPPAPLPADAGGVAPPPTGPLPPAATPHGAAVPPRRAPPPV